MEEINSLNNAVKKAIQDKKEAEEERDKAKKFAEETVEINEKIVAELSKQKRRQSVISSKDPQQEFTFIC